MLSYTYSDVFKRFAIIIQHKTTNSVKLAPGGYRLVLDTRLLLEALQYVVGCQVRQSQVLQNYNVRSCILNAPV